MEVEPLAYITETRVKDFILKSIIYQYDLPKVLITDNDRQFNGARLCEFCESHGIEHRFTPVGHPQANEEMEVTNRTLLQDLKARLDRTEEVTDG